MLQQERHQQILAKLSLLGQIRVKDLSQEFQVTEDCIRKDLNALEKQGLLKRIHGGAMPIRQNLHIFNVDERIIVRSLEKQEIAKKAIELIEPGSVVFLGISSINLDIAKLIFQKGLHITLATNMVSIMSLFTKSEATKIIFLGGTFNNSGDGFIGSITIDQLKNYRFDLAFIGVVGIDVYDGKVMTYDVNDGLTKKAAINASKKCYLVAENAKMALDGNYSFAHLEDFTGYISEGQLPKHLSDKIKEFGLEII